MPPRGSTRYKDENGEPLIVGSPEYVRAQRNANKLKHKLSHDKYMAKQRKLMEAAKVALNDKIPLEQALEEVGMELQAIRELRERRRNDPDHFKPYDPAADTSLILEPEREIEFIADIAKREGLPYQIAKRIMDEFNDSKWDEEFEKARSVTRGEEA